MSQLLEKLLTKEQRAAANAADVGYIASTVAQAEEESRQGFVSVQHYDATIGAVLPPTMAKAIEKRREEYRAALKAHDWHFEQADDGTVYRRGVTERARLMVDAASLDVDFVIWNEVAPPEYRRIYVTDGRRKGELNFGAWSLPGAKA